VVFVRFVVKFYMMYLLFNLRQVDTHIDSSFFCLFIEPIFTTILFDCMIFYNLVRKDTLKNQISICHSFQHMKVEFSGY
jgi:hypothetical protein